jgi:steroid delta-isomerase-like uncharacterized protein
MERTFVKMTRLLALLLACAPSIALAGPAENEVIARRAVDQVLGEGRFDLNRELFDPGYLYHSGDRDYSVAETEANTRDLRTAFPDLAVHVDQAVAAGDVVSIRWSGTGTNTAAAGGFPGNGRRVRFSGTAFIRFHDGRMIEEWGLYDGLALVRQLGFSVTPPRP